MVPDGWEKHPVGKLCRSIVPGRNKPKEFGGAIPWVTTPEISGRYVPSIKQQHYISETAAKECGAKIIPKGSVIIAAVGELGLTAIASQNVILNQQLHAFVCPDNVDNEYLAYFLSSQKPYMDTVASKTTIPYMNKSNCESIPVLLPKLIEQRKIAKILGTWDKAIATTEKLIEASNQQKKALMQQLLTGKKRFAGFEGEWKTAPLSSVCTRLTEKNKGQSTNVVTISAQHGLIKQEEFFKKSVASATLDNYFILRKGQFAYNKSYSSGYPMGAIKRLNRYNDAVVTSLYICFEIIDESKTSACFMEQYFESGLLNRGLTKIAAEGGRAHGLLNVKPADFMRLKITIPCYEEQKKIASILTAADKKTAELQTKLTHLKQEKKALMQQLLTGKRRVKPDIGETV
ncbi:restriction endonuclease subunit S [Endozoicomonas sp. Mp262]|uniref:restriction endonuclease subunit S n=1 Tax=Endozoicomonas sp. Mp262 TaxID=2919499 RepID=UPI0021DA73BE